MINKKLLLKLYCDRKLSMKEIADKLCVTPNKIEYWLKKYEIPRRSWSESAYVKQNPSGDPFKIKKNLTNREKELLIASLMLYLSEGGRKRDAIQLGNLNPKVIKIFLDFLRKVCQIKEDKVKIYVRLHKKFDKNKARIYWSEILKMPVKQVLVYTHNDPRSKANKQRSEYGIATLQFNNVKLKKWLDDKIKECVETLLKV